MNGNKLNFLLSTVKALAAAVIPLVFVSSCNEGAARLEVDIREHLDPVTRIVMEKVPGLPSDSAGAPFYSWRENAVMISLPRETRVALDVNNATLNFEAEIRSDGFAGEAEVTVYLCAGPQVYSDPDAFVVTRRGTLPGDFRIEATDSRIARIFSRDRAYAGLKVSFFSSGESGYDTVYMTIGRFTVLLSGVQNRY